MHAMKMILGLGCFAGMSLGLAACGGFSNLGDGAEAGEGGDAGSGGSAMGGTGGTGSGKGGKSGMGTGGTTMPGAGGTGTGGTMFPGTGGTTMPGAGGTTMPGAGGTTMPGAGGTTMPGAGGSNGTPTSCANLPCGSMCLGIDNPMAPDSTGFSGTCSADGICSREPVECPQPERCMSAEDCDQPVDLGCNMCANGELACPENDCVMGICITRVPSCEAPDIQCADAACGTPCDPCVAGSMCTGAPIATCNSAGQCQYGPAECGAACMTEADCVQDLVCQVCEPSGTCATEACINGRCQLICPVPMDDSCETDMDCPTPPPFCEMCTNGSCANTTCIDKKCVFGCQDD